MLELSVGGAYAPASDSEFSYPTEIPRTLPLSRAGTSSGLKNAETSAGGWGIVAPRVIAAENDRRQSLTMRGNGIASSES